MTARKKSSIRTTAVFTLSCIIVAAGVGQCVLRDEREMQKDMAPLTDQQRRDVTGWMQGKNLERGGDK